MSTENSKKPLLQPVQIIDAQAIMDLQYKADQLEACFENLLISLKEERAIPKLFTIDCWGYELMWQLLSFIEKEHPQLFAEFRDYRNRDKKEASAQSADTAAAKEEANTAKRLIRSCFSRLSSSASKSSK